MKDNKEIWYTAHLKITYRDISTEQLIKLIRVLNAEKIREWGFDNKVEGCYLLQDYIIEPDYDDIWHGADGYFKITFMSNCYISGSDAYFKNLVRYIKETTGIELP